MKNDQNSRTRACSSSFLGDYSGYLQTDGYGACDGLHQVTKVGCLAYVRHKLMDAKKFQRKGKSGKPDKALAKIQKLYGIKSRLKAVSVNAKQSQISMRSYLGISHISNITP